MWPSPYVFKNSSLEPATCEQQVESLMILLVIMSIALILILILYIYNMEEKR